MDGLRAKGYGRSELELAYVKSLSSSAALIGGVAVRYTADGQQLERVGVTYVLHKTETGWNFATGHPLRSKHDWRRQAVRRGDPRRQ